MAHATASMLAANGSLHPGGSHRAIRVRRPPALSIRAQQSASDEEEAPAGGRRAMLALVAGTLAGGSFAQAVLADAAPIKIGPPPPPSGGLPGTLNSDQARDLELPLKQRFYLQPLAPEAAAARAKESAKEIVGVKKLIDKKAWPYVQMDLRLRASYLRYDLNTVISGKPRGEKKPLRALTETLFAKIDRLDHAAKIKSTSEAEKYYAETVSALDDVLSKLG